MDAYSKSLSSTPYAGAIRNAIMTAITNAAKKIIPYVGSSKKPNKLIDGNIILFSPISDNGRAFGGSGHSFS